MQHSATSSIAVMELTADESACIVGGTSAGSPGPALPQDPFSPAPEDAYVVIVTPDGQVRCLGGGEWTP